MVWPFFSSTPESPCMSPKHKQVDGGNDEPAEKTVEEALECDYERDCTKLYKAIENAMNPLDYDAIVKFLDTGYWPGSFFADSIKPVDQVRTWVTRFDNEDPNKVKWSQLPLHLSIVCNAPASIIGRLVKLYPQALRCTDDQHMLPLHLALRHGCDDEIVAFLLLRFPDAVNAKGKNGRTAVDCAMRAKDKLRGKILEIFVEKTKGKSHSTATKENKHLRTEIDKRNTLIDELRIEYDTMKTTKNTIEADLLVKIQELEQSKKEIESDLMDRIERLESEKLVQTIEHQRKIDDVMKREKHVKDAEEKVQQEVATLRTELETLQDHVTKAVTPTDWKRIKKEVELSKAYRFKHTRSETKNTIDTLKEELEHTIQLSRTNDSRSQPSAASGLLLENDLIELKDQLYHLEKAETNAKTTSDVVALRKEVDQIKKELSERSEASKMKLELVTLKKAMEMELRDAEGKTSDEIAMLKRAIIATNIDKLESKTNTELSLLKNELEQLKQHLQERVLETKTQKDIHDLQLTLESKIALADATSKKELESMKQIVDSLQESLQTKSSNNKNSINNDELIMIKKDLQELKDQLKKKETQSLIVNEAESIKQALDAELKKSEGNTQVQLLKMQESIKNMSLEKGSLESKGVYELQSIKSELYNVKEQLKSVEMITKTQQELEDLKTNLANEIQKSKTRTETELMAMKQAVDDIKHLEQQESKSLKETLANEIQKMNDKTRTELLEMKRLVDSIDMRRVESTRNPTTTKQYDWDAMNNEIQSLKEELKQKQTVAATSTNTDQKEFNEMKAVLEHLKEQQQHVVVTNTNTKRQQEDYFDEIRKEMDILKETLNNKTMDELKLKQEIELLKEDGRKHKAGLKSFLSKRISSYNTNKKLHSNGSDDDGSMMNMKEEPYNGFVTTYRPPSLVHGSKKYIVESNSDNETSPRASSSKSGPLPPRSPYSVKVQHQQPNQPLVVETVTSVDTKNTTASTTIKPKTSGITISSSKSSKKLDCCDAPLMATIMNSSNDAVAIVPPTPPAQEPEPVVSTVTAETRDEAPVSSTTTTTIPTSPSNGDMSEASNKSKSSLFTRMRSFRKVRSIVDNSHNAAANAANGASGAGAAEVETDTVSSKSMNNIKNNDDLSQPEPLVRTTQSKIIVTTSGTVEMETM